MDGDAKAAEADPAQPLPHGTVAWLDHTDYELARRIGELDATRRAET